MGDINKDGYEGEIVLALGGEGIPGSLLMLQLGLYVPFLRHCRECPV